jgi:hypothetical protein
LGCGDGPASFNAELTALGGDVTSVDPTYQFDRDAFKDRISEVYDEVMSQVRETKNDYIWKNIPSVDALGEIRMDAMNAFLADYEVGKNSGRYILGNLQILNFENNQFELALCSHYLFLYSNQVDLDQHLSSIAELCRVAKEVRIYPLLSLDGEVSPHFEAVVSNLNARGVTTSLVDVAYRFQKGANQMLVVQS